MTGPQHPEHTGYDQAVSAHLDGPSAWPASSASPSPFGGHPARPTGRARFLAFLVAMAIFVAPAVVGYQVAQNADGAPTGADSTFQPSAFQPLPSPTGGTGTGSTGAIDVEAIADRLDDSVVNLTTTLASGGQAAGSGIILTASGLVLTNNHVIADSTSIEAEIGATGRTFSAEVLGYDVAEDVALLQLEDASGLRAVEVADSSTLDLGEAVIAIGNAGGRGGPPSVNAGSVTALDQQITASEADGSNAQTLFDLIQTDANIQSGDSGGPLIDSNGDVVGMNAAASAGNGRGLRYPGAGGNEGYAIPIENALEIADAIRSGKGGDGIHIGANRALLGVAVQDDSSRGGLPGRPATGTGRGAAVVGVDPGSGADRAGIAEGDTITAVDGVSVTSARSLTDAMTAFQPGETIEVTWVDESGRARSGNVKLGSGPPA